jgi:hypothetical protein
MDRSLTIPGDAVRSEPEELDRHPLRCAAIQAVVSSLSFALAMTLRAVLDELARGWSTYGFGGQCRWSLALAVSVGLVTGPTALVAFTAARLRPSLARDLAAASVAAVIAFVGLWLAYFQALYLQELRVNPLDPQSFARTGQFFLARLEGLLGARRDTFVVAAAGAMPFGLFTVLRLRRVRVLRATLSLVFATGALGFPLLFLRRFGALPMDRVGVWLIVGASLMPLAANVGDRLERRIEEWLAGDESPSRAPVPSSVHLARFAFSILVVLALACAWTETAAFLVNPRSASSRPPAWIERRFHALRAGRLPRPEIAALMSSALTFSCRARPEIARGEPLLIALALDLVAPHEYQPDREVAFVLDWCVTGSVRAWVDDGPEDSGVDLEPCQQIATILSEGNELAPGRHVLHCAWTLKLAAPTWEEDGVDPPPPLWSARRVDEIPFDVRPGGSSVKPVVPDFPPSSCTIEWRSPSPTNPPGAPPAILVTLDDLPVTVAGWIQVWNDRGERVPLADGKPEISLPPDRYGSVDVCAAPGQPTVTTLALAGSLDASVRELTVKILPDPQWALWQSVSATEVYGETIERTISVPGR